jgi:hypothetical protein
VRAYDKQYNLDNATIINEQRRSRYQRSPERIEKMAAREERKRFRVEEEAKKCQCLCDKKEAKRHSLEQERAFWQMNC